MQLSVVAEPLPQTDRWRLYRLLGDRARLRLLALAAEEELALSELAELLEESQPNVSRHAAPLRRARLLGERRQGTRTFVRVAPDALDDPVVRDAIEAGRAVCRTEGSLVRIAEIVSRREAKSRDYFDLEPKEQGPLEITPELPAFLTALRVLVPERELAVDAGTGSGALLDFLAPVFHRVVAIDRSPAQLRAAERRVELRGYSNVCLLCAELDDERVRRAAGNGADLVVAVRLLHHAPRPRALVESLFALMRPGGRLVILDYQRHSDELFRERQADVWSGFEPGELEALGSAVGLSQIGVHGLPPNLIRDAADGHVGWQVLVGVRPTFEREGETKWHRPQS